MSNKYEEYETVKYLKSKGISIENKVISYSSHMVIGIKTQGKIDFLCNYHGYVRRSSNGDTEVIVREIRKPKEELEQSDLLGVY